MFYRNVNDENRQRWLKKVLSLLPHGARILDAGAGELRNQPLCGHLAYFEIPRMLGWRQRAGRRQRPQGFADLAPDLRRCAVYGQQRAGGDIGARIADDRFAESVGG